MTQKIKFQYNQKVIIKKGFFAGYKAVIQDIITENDPQDETIEIIKYKVAIEGVPSNKREGKYTENEMFAYRKYLFF